MKKVERLLTISRTSFYKDKSFCPYCNTVVNNDIPFEEHLFKTHFDTEHTCNVQLPKEGDTMTFCNYKNLLGRPCIVYADFESTLIPTRDLRKLICIKLIPRCVSLYALLTVQEISYMSS